MAFLFSNLLYNITILKKGVVVLFIKNSNTFLKRKWEAVYRGSMLYFDFFQAVENALRIYNSFLSKDEKQKEREKEEVEAKILLLFKILKEYLRDMENEWGTREIQSAWYSVFFCKIILLRIRLNRFVKKAKDNQRLVREAKSLASYLSMAYRKGNCFLRKGGIFGE